MPSYESSKSSAASVSDSLCDRDLFWCWEVVLCSVYSLTFRSGAAFILL